MFGYLYIRKPAPRPPIYYPLGTDSASTSPMRLDLVDWYTSGFT